MDAKINAKSQLLTPSDRTLFNWKRFRPDTSIGGMSIIGAYLDKRLPPSLGVPEVAFLGRSNVGKSSLLNCLSNVGTVSNTDAARVGKTPGATASVNLYALLHKSKKSGGGGNEAKPILGFADLPGFGYAKLSKSVKASVELAAERYLGKRKELAIGILLLDIRRTPSDDDRAVLAALYDLGLPIMVVATKVDKIDSAAVLQKQRTKIRDGLGLPDGQPFCVSSTTGQGKKELWQIILDACEDRVKELIGETENQEEEDDDGDDLWYTEGANEDDYENEDGDLEYDQGYDWVQSFGADGNDNSNNDNNQHNDDNDYDDYNNNNNREIDNNDWKDDESMKKMKVNEDNQAAQKEAMRLKNLRKRTRDMERKGEI
uniref:EngB-type G domain-containing protein n=1 Tax=Eucampia antarctica TaxID=49252 RepID=A0A7S2W5T7_9STRA